MPYVLEYTGMPCVLEYTGMPCVLEYTGMPCVLEYTGIPCVLEYTGMPCVLEYTGISIYTELPGVLAFKHPFCVFHSFIPLFQSENIQSVKSVKCTASLQPLETLTVWLGYRSVPWRRCSVCERCGSGHLRLGRQWRCSCTRLTA